MIDFLIYILKAAGYFMIYFSVGTLVMFIVAKLFKDFDRESATLTVVLWPFIIFVPIILFANWLFEVTRR